VASPQMRVQSETPTPAGKGRRSALRLLSIERTDEIYPVLLEEIVALGHPRALIAKVNFETSEIAPSASLNCSKALLQRFETTLFSMENPLARILHTLEPELVPGRAKRGVDYYHHPLIYRNSTACWEAERARSGKCVAVENYHLRGHGRGGGQARGDRDRHRRTARPH
jgi:hypothetical protein